VFIDDREDFYGLKFYLDYVGLIQTIPGWQNVLQKYQIEWVLLPKTSRLIKELQLDNNWLIEAVDQAAVLVVRKKIL
jgi:hypothetical protein